MKNVLIRAALEKLRGFQRRPTRDWRVVYGKRDFQTRREVDALGRTVHFRGQKGELPSSIVEHKRCQTLFLARVPNEYNRQQLREAMHLYGSGVRRCVLNVVRRFAIVQFHDIETADAALQDLQANGLSGNPILAEFQRSVQVPRRDVKPFVGDPDMSIDGMPAQTDSVEVHEEEGWRTDECGKQTTVAVGCDKSSDSDDDGDMLAQRDSKINLPLKRTYEQMDSEGTTETDGQGRTHTASVAADEGADEDDEWEEVGRSGEVQHQTLDDSGTATEADHQAGSVLLERATGWSESVGQRASLEGASRQQLAEALRGAGKKQ